MIQSSSDQSVCNKDQATLPTIKAECLQQKSPYVDAQENADHCKTE